MRLKCEREWALKLKTYPFGLNQNGARGNSNPNVDEVVVGETNCSKLDRSARNYKKIMTLVPALVPATAKIFSKN